MTPLKKPVTRRTNFALDGSYGKDKRKTLAVELVPGTDQIADLITLRPYGTRRSESIALVDVYRLALRARINRELLEKARAKKVKKQAARERRSLDYQERKLRKSIKGDK